jgi:lipoate-protein ligase A
VASVRSRVVNLTELSPDLTIERMRRNMILAFEDVYGMDAAPFVLTGDMQTQIAQLKEVYGNWEYLYGAPLAFTFSCEEKFVWGHIRLQLQIESGTILHAEVYSDAMDWLLPEKIATALTNCRFVLTDLEKALSGDPVAADILSLLKKNI